MIALTAVGPASTHGQTPKKLQIGFITSMTGFGSHQMKSFPQGAELCADWLNGKGGINIKGQTYQVEIVVQDDKGTAEGAASAANRLVNEDGIKFIVGGIPVFGVIAINSITEPAKIIHVSLWNNTMPDEFGPKTPYTFLTHISTLGGMESALDWLKEKYPNVKNVVGIMVDDGAAPTIGQLVSNQLQKRGLSLKGDLVRWPPDTVDFSPIATKAIQRKADAICWLNGWTEGLFIKAVRDQGYKGLIMSTTFTEPAITMEMAGKPASTDWFANGIVAGAPQNPPMVQMVEKMAQAKYPPVRNYQFEMFQAVWSLTQAIQSAQSLDTTAVKNAWEKMDAFETVFGPGGMGGEKTFGIKHAIVYPAALYGLENGQIKFLKWQKVTIP